MKCIHRKILPKGSGETARLFSICECPELILEYKLDAEFAKIRNPLVCEDCTYRVEFSDEEIEAKAKLSQFK